MIYTLRLLFFIFTLTYCFDSFACDLEVLEHKFFDLFHKDTNDYFVSFDLKGQKLSKECKEFSIFSLRNGVFILSFIDDVDKKFLISGKFEKAIYLPVLKKNINKDEFIKKAFVYKKKFPRSNIVSHVIFREHDLVGRFAKKNLKQGEVVFRSDIETRFVIKRRDIVDVVFKMESLELRRKSMALDSGTIGDKIKFRNIKSKREFFATIKSSTEASVN